MRQFLPQHPWATSGSPTSITTPRPVKNRQLVSQPPPSREESPIRIAPPPSREESQSDSSKRPKVAGAKDWPHPVAFKLFHHFNRNWLQQCTQRLTDFDSIQVNALKVN